MYRNVSVTIPWLLDLIVKMTFIQQRVERLFKRIQIVKFINE